MATLTLKERLALPSSKIGSVLKGAGFYIFMAAGATAEIADAMGLVDKEWVPTWLKVTLIAASILSRVSGMLSVHPEAKEEYLGLKDDLEKLKSKHDEQV